MFALSFSPRIGDHSMRKRLRATLLTLAILLMLTGSGVWKTARAQGIPTLTLLQPVTGEISSTRPEQRWTFSAKKGQRLSLRMQATSGDLEPYVELLDSSGKSLATSSNTSLRNATIDAFTIPDTTDFTVRATRMPINQGSVQATTQAVDQAATQAAVGSSTPTNGAFSLSLLPGYSFLLLNDPSGMNAPMRTWRDASSMSHFVDGKLELSLNADSSYTWTNAGDKVGIFREL